MSELGSYTPLGYSTWVGLLIYDIALRRPCHGKYKLPPPFPFTAISNSLALLSVLSLSVLLAQKALSVLTTYGIKPSHGLQGWLSYSRFCPLHRYLSYYFPCLGKVYLYVTISSLSERPLELNFETGSFDARRFVMPTLSPFI